MRPSRLLEPAEWAVVRAPLLPAWAARPRSPNDPPPADDGWAAVAVAVGSPDLSAALSRRAAAASADPRDPRAARVASREARFRIRMATRPTPYGLFAGVALATWGERTDLTLAAAPPRTRTRPDMEWLLGLIDALQTDDTVRRHLQLIRNPMLLDAAGRLSLPSTVRVRAEDTRGQDVSVRATALARRTVQIARVPIAYEELMSALVGPDAEHDAVEAAIDVMCRHEILLTDLSPAPTGGDPLGRLRGRLARSGAAPGIAAQLDELAAALEAWDGLPAPERLAELPRLAKRMAKLHPTRPSSCPVQVDMALTLDGAAIHRSVASEAARAAELLLRISPYPTRLPHLRAYREAFLTRYGTDRSVPLLELLDPIVGLGPPSSDSLGRPDRDEAARADRRDRALHLLASRAAHEGRQVVELDEATAAELETWAPTPETAPLSMELVVLVAARSASAIDAGAFQLVVGPNLGVGTAGRHLSRFADLLGQPALRALGDVAAAEAARDPQRLRAELVYLPTDARAANIVLHPSLRAAEIALNAQAGVAADGIVPLDELVVSLDGDRLRVDWPARELSIAAVAGHMLNLQLAPAVARFLLDVEADQHPVLSPFDWGPLAGAPFLPRVQSGRVVLAPAQWRLPTQTAPRDASAFAEAVAAWRHELDVPRHVYLTVADNRLLLDLDSNEGVAILAEEARRDQAAHSLVLQEALPALEHAWLQGADGGHLVELVVPFVRRAVTTAADRSDDGPPHRAAPPHATAAQRLRPPGSDWLYTKLYCAPAAHNDLLAGPVRELGEFALGAGLADRWFFIRYADPEPHLRIRFHGQPLVLLGALMTEVSSWATELIDAGVCRHFSIDTYEREVERYGGAAGIDAAERVFAADSAAVCELLEAVRASPEALNRSDVAILGLDRLLGDCGIEGARRLEWLRRHAQLQRADGAEYRTRKSELRTLLEGDGVAWHPIIAILERRAESMSAAVARLEALEAEGTLTRPVQAMLADLAHLHCNRLVGGTPQDEHRILALLRRTREALAHQAAVVAPGAHG
ncbi:MAG TPA: lantibiotic dehydratase [Solirubrobacteraceae bacterium]|nr:lantibiotic dehydratase [Solirubrobacteraceae bacterium]